MALTRPEVDHDVYEENGVGKTVEGDPARAEVVVEERDGHGQDYQVGHEEQQHTKVPVKPAKNYNRRVKKLAGNVQRAPPHQQND